MFKRRKKTDREYQEQRQEMIKTLRIDGYIKTDKVADAMNTIPRHRFLPKDQKIYAYEDRPLPVGKNQTISAPHMVAIMTEALELKEDEKVLEIGAGTGYHSAVVAHIVKEGYIYTVEKIEELAQKARENIKKTGYINTEVITGDGTQGYQKKAPYDRISVTASAPDIPTPLIEQLKPGGQMLIPIGTRYHQNLIKIIKTHNGEITKKNLGGCIFVPLIGKHGWKN